MKRSSIVVVSLLCFSFVPAIARADDDDIGTPPPLPAAAPPAAATTATTTTASAVDTVHLRNGGMVRGHVTEIIPGDHVTILADGGEKKRVAWADVERVVVASTPIPPAGSVAATAEAPPPMVGPKVRVHITSTNRVILYRKAAGTGGFTQTCDAPCDMDLPVGDTYRIAGNGIAQSKEFRLEAGPSGFVDLVVDPPSKGGMFMGGGLAGLGALTTFVGFVMAVAGAAEAGNDCSHYTTYGTSYSSQSSCERAKADGPQVRDAGLVTMLVGAGVGGLGLLVFFNSATTDVDQHHTSHDAASRSLAPRDAFVREPAWKTATSTPAAEASRVTPAATFPVLFQGTF